jgi:hypothetical protein
MAVLSSYNATFPADVLLDSGVLYAGASLFGAFSGGLKFDPGTEWRSVEFDGKRSNIKGLDRKAKMMPKISGTVIQLSTSVVDAIEPGSTAVVTGAWTGSTSYAPLAAGSFIAASDYLADVRAIWQRGGGGYVQIRFPAAVVTKYDISAQDGQEVAIAIEIEARLDLSVTNSTSADAPFRIEYLAAV